MGAQFTLLPAHELVDRAYRPLHVLLKREGDVLNRGTIQRLFRGQGLSVRKRREQGRHC